MKPPEHESIDWKKDLRIWIVGLGSLLLLWLLLRPI